MELARPAKIRSAVGSAITVTMIPGPPPTTMDDLPESVTLNPPSPIGPHAASAPQDASALTAIHNFYLLQMQGLLEQQAKRDLEQAKRDERQAERDVEYENAARTSGVALVEIRQHCQVITDRLEIVTGALANEQQDKAALLKVHADCEARATKNDARFAQLEARAVATEARERLADAKEKLASLASSDREKVLNAKMAAIERREKSVDARFAAVESTAEANQAKLVEGHNLATAALNAKIAYVEANALDDQVKATEAHTLISVALTDLQIWAVSMASNFRVFPEITCRLITIDFIGCRCLHKNSS